jgi:hypothetical protein
MGLNLEAQQCETLLEKEENKIKQIEPQRGETLVKITIKSKPKRAPAGETFKEKCIKLKKIKKNEKFNCNSGTYYFIYV